VYPCTVLGGNYYRQKNIPFSQFVAEHHFYADPDPSYYFDADQDPDPPTTQLSQANK
jgi:hypothetical protein